MMLHTLLYVISMLIPLSVWQPCHCGDDKNSGAVGSDKAPKGTDGKAEKAQTDVANSDGGIVFAQSDYVLDVESQDISAFRYNNCDYDGNKIMFIVPKNGVSVAHLVCSKVEIWTPAAGEKFEYAKLFFKNGLLALISIVKNTPFGPNCRWYFLEEDKWVACSNNYMEKMDGLRVFTPHKGDFTIHLEDKESSDQCIIFEERLFGAPMRLIFPRDGHHVKEVKDGSAIIWKASGEEKCLSCDLYLKRGEPSFFVLTIREGEAVRFLYFAKTTGERRNEYEWTKIVSEEFDKKVAKARTARRASGAFGSMSGLMALKTGFKSGWTDLTNKLPSRDSMNAYVGKFRGHKTQSNGMNGSDGTKSDPAYQRENDHPADQREEATPENGSSGHDGKAPTSPATSSENQATRPKEKPIRRARSRNANWQQPNLPSPTSDSSIDISVQNEGLYHLFYYFCDGIQTVLILPKDGHSIAKLMNAQEELWTAQPGEALEYAKLFLDKSFKHQCTLLASSSSNMLRKRYYERRDGKWMECSEACLARMKEDLFTIDLENVQDDEKCTIFETMFMGVTTRHFIPKNGHHAMEVRHGSTIVWKAADKERCVFSLTYLRDGQPSLVLLTIVSGDEKTFKYFEKNGQEWTEIEEGEFNRKRDEMIQPKKGLLEVV